jgi:hypothetical protein
MRALYYRLFRFELRLRCWWADRIQAQDASGLTLPPALLRYRVSELLGQQAFLTIGEGCARLIEERARSMTWIFPNPTAYWISAVAAAAPCVGYCVPFPRLNFTAPMWTSRPSIGAPRTSPPPASFATARSLPCLTQIGTSRPSIASRYLPI